MHDDHDVDHVTGGDEGGETEGDWIDGYPSETVEAVPPNEVTAGLDVTLRDLDEAEAPLMVTLHQRYPEEDGIEGDTVSVYGEHAVLQLISTLSEGLSSQFEGVPWDDG